MFIEAAAPGAIATDPEREGIMTRNMVQRISKLACLMVLVTSFALAMVQQTEDAEVMLGAALHLEEVEADLEAAIAKYHQVVAHDGADRETAGRALLRIGVCYEKLGRSEAAATYERVIADFADLPELVSEALVRVRSAGVGGAVSLPGQELVSRRVFQFPPRFGAGGEPSPDGRYYSRTDWESGDIAVSDLATNELRRLSDNSDAGMAYSSVFSPDSRTVAYGWLKENGWDLRLVNVDGTGQRVLYGPDGVYFGVAMDWSADGAQILAIAATDFTEADILLISVADGSARVIKELRNIAPNTMDGKGSLSPDGRYVVHDIVQGPEGRKNISVISLEDGSEWPLIESPAVDRGPIWTPGGNRVLFVSDRGGSFDLWAQDVVDGRAQGVPKLLRAGIGRVTGLTDDGSLYYGISRTYFDIRTASYDPDTGALVANTQTGFSTRPGRNSRPLFSPDGRSLLYYHRDVGAPAGGGRLLVVVDLESGQERELTLSRREFGGAFKPLGFSPDGSRVLLYGLGRESNEPALYWMDFGTGATERAVGGWTVNARLSPDGTTAYAPGLRSDGIAAVDLATGSDRRIGPMMPEESVSGFGFALSPDGRTLAYQRNQEEFGPGAGLFLLDVASGDVRSLGDDLPFYWEFAWTPDGRYVLATLGPEDFDGVTEGSIEAVVWKIPVDGGEPEPTPITIGSDPSFGGLTFHPDGRTMAYVDGVAATEIWVLENLIPTPGARR